MTHKMKTAAAMGMLKLYTVGSRKTYIRAQDYYIRANSQAEAQEIWNQHQKNTFLDPAHPLPDTIIYRSEEYRETEYDYDTDNTMETVEEEKFNKESPRHLDVLDSLYRDGGKTEKGSRKPVEKVD